MLFKGHKKIQETLKQRIKNSKVWYNRYADTFAKKRAEAIKRNFAEGIHKNIFGLDRLKQSTIDKKERMGYKKPETPLYGLGQGKRSYRNMLNIRKLKNGSYRVYPSSRYHHSGRVTLRTLFYVHEFGAVIDTGKAVIRIPPRPVFSKAIDMTEKGLNTKKVKKLLISYLNFGKDIFKDIS